MYIGVDVDGGVGDDVGGGVDVGCDVWKEYNNGAVLYDRICKYIIVYKRAVLKIIGVLFCYSYKCSILIM